MKNKPWSNHKRLKKEEIPTKEQLILMAEGIKNLRERALFIIAYLTGGRISEIVREPFLRKIKYRKGIKTDEAGNKKVVIVRNDKKSPMQEDVERTELNYKGIRRDNISWMYKEGRRIMVISMQNRKNRRMKRKRIPIPYDKEKELLDMLVEFLDKLQPDESLFPFGKGKAEKIIKEATGMNPHFLRDIRATRLVIDYNFNEYKLVKYMGWSDGRPASRYVILNTDSILGGDY